MSEIKQIISMRLENTKRKMIQEMASQLYIRESDMYRISVSYTLHKLVCLMDDRFNGSDLLPLFLEIRAVMVNSSGFNKHQLYKIFNSGHATPEKFVAMTDIELLLMPSHKLIQHLQKLGPNTLLNNDVEASLRTYLINKYNVSI